MYYRPNNLDKEYTTNNGQLSCTQFVLPANLIISTSPNLHAAKLSPLWIPTWCM